jgi:hypothetical protein
MHEDQRRSDQYYDWSDTPPRKSSATHPAAEETATGETAAGPGGDPARFVDRTVQALRQAGVQVRSRTGSWAEVLPLGESVGIEAADGLRALRVPATGAAVCGELSASSRNTQADLRHQPRIAATTRAAVEGLGERHGHNDTGGLVPTTADGRHSGRQHAPELLLASTTQTAGEADR